MGIDYGAVKNGRRVIESEKGKPRMEGKPRMANEDLGEFGLKRIGSWVRGWKIGKMS